MKPSMTTIVPDTKVKPKFNYKEGANNTKTGFEIKCNQCGSKLVLN